MRIIPHASKLRQGGIFVVASVAAGFLHYLFQVVAARALDAAAFAALNGWLAEVALFTVVSGWLQYAANFAPMGRQILRRTLVATSVLIMALAAGWYFTSGLTWVRGFILVAASCWLGWLTGQVQIRMAFAVMAVSGFSFAATKLGLAFLPLFEADGLERFAFPLIAAYLPALLVLGLDLWNAQDVPVPEKRSWGSPLTLSAASALIPQFDMIVMKHTQSAESFQEFARASLFYKGIYFVVFFFTQWMLPQQILAGEQKTPRPLMLALSVALAASVASTALAPWVSRWFLNWPSAPALDLVFWSCLHMSLLTLLFLWIQETCALGRPGRAGLALAALGGEAALQYAFGLPAGTYLIAVNLAQLLVLSIVHKLPSPSVQVLL